MWVEENITIYKPISTSRSSHADEKEITEDSYKKSAIKI